MGRETGQESAGIAAGGWRAEQDRRREEIGYVADLFTPDSMKRLSGDTAIGHVRYSTAGGSMLRNEQPIVASTNKDPIAVAHNGNLVNGRSACAARFGGQRRKSIRLSPTSSSRDGPWTLEFSRLQSRL
ncbi:MAG TPA: hypothetical protein VF443_05120 [Nitrospira sp.]